MSTETSLRITVLVLLAAFGLMSWQASTWKNKAYRCEHLLADATEQAVLATTPNVTNMIPLQKKQREGTGNTP